MKNTAPIVTTDGQPANGAIDRAAALDHLYKLGYADGDAVVLCAFPPKKVPKGYKGGKWNKHFHCTMPDINWDDIEEFLHSHRLHSLGFVANPGGTENAHITAPRCHYFEFDNIESIEEQLDAWKHYDLPQPTMQVITGGKSVHNYFLLDSPDTPQRWRDRQQRLLHDLLLSKSDGSLAKQAQVMRLAGGWHPSTGQRTHITSYTGNRYTVEQLEQHLPQPQPKASRPIALPIEQTEAAKKRYLDALYSGCVPGRGEAGSGGYPDAFRVASAVVKEFGPAEAVPIIERWSPTDLANGWDVAKKVDSIAKMGTIRSDGGTIIAIARANGWQDPWDKSRRQSSNIIPLRRGDGGGGSETTEAESSIEVSDRPVDVELAERIFCPEKGYASDGVRLYRYNPKKGYWQALGDSESKSLILHWLKRCYRLKKDKETGEVFQVWPFGKSNDIKSSYDVILHNEPRAELLDSHRRYLVFKDKTLELETQRVLPHSPDYLATTALNAPLNLTDQCPEVFQRFVETCFGDNLLQVIRAVVRWAIDPTMPYEKAVYLKGNSGSGKGTFIEFLQLLLPQHLRQSLENPDVLSSPEKVYQYVKGRRLVCFPDVTRPMSSLSITYSLIENAPVAVRRLHSSDTDEIALGVRLIFASTNDYQLRDGADGWLRRVLTIPTLQRFSADTDPTIKAALIGDTPEHETLRGAVAGWALAMDRQEAIALLRTGHRSIPELADAAETAEANADQISGFLDRCCVPTDNPDEDVDWAAVEAAYVAYCESENYRRSVNLSKLKNLVRKHLPLSHSPRRRVGEERRLFDTGWQIRPGLFGHNFSGEREFKRSLLGEGGLSAIRAALAANPPSHLNKNRTVPTPVPVSPHPVPTPVPTEETSYRQGCPGVPTETATSEMEKNLGSTPTGSTEVQSEEEIFIEESAEMCRDTGTAAPSLGFLPGQPVGTPVGTAPQPVGTDAEIHPQPLSPEEKKAVAEVRKCWISPNLEHLLKEENHQQLLARLNRKSCDITLDSLRDRVVPAFLKTLEH